MPRIQGTIQSCDATHRLIRVKTRKNIVGIHFQRAVFNRFSQFLTPGTVIVTQTRRRVNPRHPAYRFQVTEVLEIVVKHRRGKISLYSRKAMRQDIRSFINSLGAKMFLDLELSMHPYRLDRTFKQEIIQAGYVLVDQEDIVIERYSVFVKPTLRTTLTKRTLKFLSIRQEDIDGGIDYRDFHEHFRALVERVRPVIVVWGKNDGISLKESYDINEMFDLSASCRFVNLLELHKNYFHLKDDLGLANAHRLYGFPSPDAQRHDALEDAMMTHDVFNAFRAVLNRERTIDLDTIK